MSIRGKAEIVGIYNTAIVAHLCHEKTNRFSRMVETYGPECLHLTIDAVRLHHEEDMGNVSFVMSKRRLANEMRVLSRSFIEDAIENGIRGKDAIETGMRVMKTYTALSDPSAKPMTMQMVTGPDRPTPGSQGRLRRQPQKGSKRPRQ